jgi:cell division ATPase FtsA
MVQTTIIPVICYISGDSSIILVNRKNQGDLEMISLNKFKTIEDLCILVTAYERMGFKLEETFLILGSDKVHLTRNKSSIKLKPQNEISESDIYELKRKIYQDLNGKSIMLGVDSINYTVDDIDGICCPIGMCCENLEGHFRILLSDRDEIEKITRDLDSCNLKIRKTVPDDYIIARPFMTEDEQNLFTFIKSAN